jgi:hypothetical protein
MQGLVSGVLLVLAFAAVAAAAVVLAGRLYRVSRSTPPEGPGTPARSSDD